AFGVFGDPGIARRAKQPVDQRRGGDRPTERVLAPARADDEDPHQDRQPTRLLRSARNDGNMVAIARSTATKQSRWQRVRRTRLQLKPEDGMEVVCTGRLTTYPGRSKYQLVVDQVELAGKGALLRLLEERRERLATEGLFAAERKRKLPYLPETIGIVTSPSG